MSTENNNQTPLSEETFKELMMQQFTKAYRKGFNDACNTINEMLSRVSENMKTNMMRDLIDDLTSLIDKLKMVEEEVNGS